MGNRDRDPAETPKAAGRTPRKARKAKSDPVSGVDAANPSTARNDAKSLSAKLVRKSSNKQGASSTDSSSAQAEVETPGSPISFVRRLLAVISTIVAFWKAWGIGAILATVLLLIFSSDDITADVVFRAPALPAGLIDAGVDPQTLIEEAIADVPSELARYEEELGRAQLIGPLQQIAVGEEVFCSAGNLKRLVEYRNPPTRNVKAATALSSLWTDYPIAAEGLERFRRYTGKKFQYVTSSIVETDGHYTLEVSITPTNAQQGAPKPEFTVPITKPTPEKAKALIRELILRVAYPEFAALIRNAKSRSDLKIETYEASAFPTPDRSAMIDFALFATLVANPEGTAPLESNRRAAFVGSRAVDAEQLTAVRFNREEMTFFLLMLNQELAQGLPDLFRQATNTALKSYALKLGQTFGAIGDAPTVGSLNVKNGTLTVLQIAAKQLEAGNPVFIEEVSTRLRQSLALAKESRLLDDPEVRSYLRDLTFGYATAIVQLLNNMRSVSESDIASTKSLADYIAFYTEELGDVLSISPFLSRDDQSLLDAVLLGSQVGLENYDDALANIDRLLRFASPCQLDFAAGLVGRLIEDKPIEVFPNEISALNVGVYNMLEKARAGGLRNFDIYNALGLSLARTGNVDAAIAAYDAAMKFRGEIPWAELNAGNAYLMLSMYPEAEARFETSIRKSLDACSERYKDWADVDKSYNAMMTDLAKSVLPAMTPAENPYLIDVSVSEQQCAIPNAVIGLLRSLAAQDKAAEYVRVFRRHISDNGRYDDMDQIVRTAVSYLRAFQCSGKLNTLPAIPTKFHAEFGFSGGKFDCSSQ